MKTPFAAVFFLLVLASFAHADTLNYTSTTCPGSGDLLNTLTNLPNCIVDSFFSFIINGLISTIQGFIQTSFTFLFSSPDPAWFCGSFQAVLSVLEALFSIALSGIALLFVVRSHDVEGRIEARKWLENLLFMIVLLAFSFTLFQILLDLNAYLATSFANSSMQNLFTPTGNLTSAIFALLMLILTIIMLLVTFITLLARYLLIPFLLLLFPIAIFLHFLPVTKDLGRALLKTIAIIVFMPTADALILFGLSALFVANDPNLAGSLVKAFAILLGFGALGVINLLMFVWAATSLLSQSKIVSTTGKTLIKHYAGGGMVPPAAGGGAL